MLVRIADPVYNAPQMEDRFMIEALMTSTAEAATDTRKELPSGRSVVLRMTDGQEEVEVRSPAGDVEVRIILTDSGPVVQLRGARLELDAAESIKIACKRFELDTTEGTELRSAGQINVHATGDVDVKGRFIQLNC
jgi:hypothetical protein